MKAKNKKLQDIKRGQGVERSSVIGNGGGWTKPTMIFEMKKSYTRTHQKQGLRKTLEY